MRYRFLTLAAALSFLVPLLAHGQVKQEVKDASITARIETLFLLNEHLNPFNINTSTSEGVVTLVGGVSDGVQRELAADLASSVEGVVRVENNIIVTPDAENEQNRRSWKQAIDDRSVTASVRARLVYNGEFKGLKVGVQTVNGVATLYGVVRSEEQRDRILRIAAETKGVQRVKNNLTVQPPERVTEKPFREVGYTMSDELIEKRIETTLLFNRRVSIRDLDVEVNNGVAILTGSVNTEEQRTLAEELTRSLGGVKDVRNDIQLNENVVVFGEPVEAESLGEPMPLEDIDPPDEPLPPAQETPTVEARPLP